MTVAEGVETAGQLDDLVALGCEQAQGFYWSEPMPATEAGQWITAADRGVVHDARPGRRRRVLVVDDDASFRTLLSLVLADSDEFELAATADDGRQAIALARQHQPDVVLLDLAMPGMGGLDAIPLIRAVAPGSQIVVMSGLEPSEVEDRALKEGASRYLVKGFDVTQIDDLLRGEPLPA